MALPKEKSRQKTFPVSYMYQSDGTIGEVADEKARGNISGLDGRISEAESDIGSLDTRLDTAEGNITSLCGRVAAVETGVANSVSFVTDQTSKTDAEKAQARANINAPDKWKLLWENASDMSSFAAQTVSINLSDYDFVLLFYRMANTNVNHGVLSTIYPVPAGDCALFGGYQANTTGMRLFTISSAGLVFAKGVYAGSDNNNILIPYKIYGIKGVAV